MPGNQELLLIVDALDPPGVRFGFGEGGQQERGQDGDDGDDHQEFDESKSGVVGSEREPGRGPGVDPPGVGDVPVRWI